VFVAEPEISVQIEQAEKEYLNSETSAVGSVLKARCSRRPRCSASIPLRPGSGACTTARLRRRASIAIHGWGLAL
jgi:hypothetical protein